MDYDKLPDDMAELMYDDILDIKAALYCYCDVMYLNSCYTSGAWFTNHAGTMLPSHCSREAYIVPYGGGWHVRNSTWQYSFCGVYGTYRYIFDSTKVRCWR